MPLLYPIAPNARAALDAEGGARTVAEARELAKGPVELVSDWLRPQPSEHEEIQGKAEAAVARGFVQLYEDKNGRPVIAVSFWKPVAGVKTKPKKVKSEKPKAAEDYTDDLYFEKKKGASKRKKKSADPNQLDLFGPDQQGAEHSDPHNPSVVIVDEEGSGASFGGVDESTPEKG
jgi:hypothetical protein